MQRSIVCLNKPIESGSPGHHDTPAHELEQLAADFKLVMNRFDSLLVSESGRDDASASEIDSRTISSLCGQLDLLGVSSAVRLRDGSRGLCGANKAARDWFSISQETLCQRLDTSGAQYQDGLDELSERMLRSGADCLRFEFQSPTSQGDWYEWGTIKARFPGHFAAGFGTLSVSRPIASIQRPIVASVVHLEEQLALFHQLDETDQEICRGIALGDSTCEIAESVALTRRTVEVRRGKILEHFGFSRKVQIVRMIVRLEENGYFDDVCASDVRLCRGESTST